MDYGNDQIVSGGKLDPETIRMLIGGQPADAGQSAAQAPATQSAPGQEYNYGGDKVISGPMWNNDQGGSETPPPPPPPTAPDFNAANLPELAAHNPNMEASGYKLDWSLPGRMADDFKIGLHLLTSSDPEKIAAGLKDVAGVQIERHNNVPYAVVQGKRYSLNKAGMSMQDAAPFLTALTASLPITSIFGALGAAVPALAAPLVQGGLVGAGTGAAMEGIDQATNKAPKAVQDYTQAALYGGAGGVIGGLISQPLGKMLQWAGRGILNKAGELTGTARQALIDAGIEPSSLSAKTLQSVHDALIGKEITPKSIVGTTNNVLAEKYGVNLSKGQATGDKSLLDWELAASKGESGPAAQRIMGGQIEQQAARTPQIVEDVANRLAPGGIINSTEAQTGQDVIDALSAAKDAAKQRASSMYDAFAQTASKHGITLPGNMSPADEIAARISQEMPDFHPKDYPGAANMLDTINERLNGGQYGDPVTIETYHGLEKVVRDAKNRAYQSNRFTEAKAYGMMLDGIKKWLDDGISSLTTAQGSTPGAMGANAASFGRPTALPGPAPAQIGSGPMLNIQSPQNAQEAALLAQQQLRDAQAAFRDFRQQFPLQAQPGDTGGRFVVQATREFPPTGQAAFDALAGGSREVTQAAEPVINKVQGILGQSDPAVANMKRSILRRIILGSADKQSTGNPPTYQAIVNRIDSALSGRSANATEAALGSDGREALGELRALFQSMARNDANPSGTSYRVNAANRGQALSKLLGMLFGGALGGIGGIGGIATGAAGAGLGATLGRAAGPMVSDALAASAARAAAAGYSAPVAGLTNAPAEAILRALQQAAIPGGSAATAGDR